MFLSLTQFVAARLKPHQHGQGLCQFIKLIQLRATLPHLSGWISRQTCQASLHGCPFRLLLLKLLELFHERGRFPIAGRPGPVPGPRANLSRSPRPPPLAPSTPRPVAQVRSRISQLLRRGPTSRFRSSLATGLTPPQRGPAVRFFAGQKRDLPVPEQGVSTHAGVSDHAEPARRSR